jgi:LDH2 family malate/lactate/ureidoglycolate dehydrogenase
MVVTPIRALLLTKEDNVAALLATVAPPTPVVVILPTSNKTLLELAVRQLIPFGHKIAIHDIANGSTVNRYGYPIGVATSDIKAGEHVHTHNMRSLLSPAPPAVVTTHHTRSAVWLKRIVGATLRCAGAHTEAAEAMAAAITQAHLRGVETHGLRRLRPYVKRIQSGAVDGMARPTIDNRGSVLVIDGHNGVGYYVAAVAADGVSKVARESGVGIALVRNSNHFGFAGYFATLIAEQGQIGIVSSNGQVCVGPEGAAKPLFSNNPLAIAAPLYHDHAFLELDLATSVTSRANIVAAARAGSVLPEGCAQDAQGKPTRDPEAALAGSLLAFGGNKGFGLLVALEALTGVLAGGAYADQVSSKETASAPEGTAHMFIAIDLDKTIGRAKYVSRLDDMLARLHGLPVAPGVAPPRYPGERRWQLARERVRGGIPLAPGELVDLMALANELGIPTE